MKFINTSFVFVRGCDAGAKLLTTYNICFLGSWNTTRKVFFLIFLVPSFESQDIGPLFDVRMRVQRDPCPARTS